MFFLIVSKTKLKKMFIKNPKDELFLYSPWVKILRFLTRIHFFCLVLFSLLISGTFGSYVTFPVTKKRFLQREGGKGLDFTDCVSCNSVLTVHNVASNSKYA